MHGVASSTFSMPHLHIYVSDKSAQTVAPGKKFHLRSNSFHSDTNAAAAGAAAGAAAATAAASAAASTACI